MTRLEALNTFVLQWLCIRLVRCTKNEDTVVVLSSIAKQGWLNDRIDRRVFQWYSIMVWPLPLTGWRNYYKFINKEARYIKLTKPKLIKFIKGYRNV
jgi:hypothetical protein